MFMSGLMLAGPRRRPRANVARKVTAGLGLVLLLALAGCNQATPDDSRGPEVTISAAAAAPVTAGKPLEFRLQAEPAPRTDLTVMVKITSKGCTLAQATGSVVIATGKSQATLPVPTEGVAVDAQGCEVTVAIAAGDGYRAGEAAEARSTLTRPQPEVTIAADSESVIEGASVSFTLTATPAPASALPVNVSWTESGSFLAADGVRTVTIAANQQTVTLEAHTDDDDADEPDGSVTATVDAGSGYTVGSLDSAAVTVTDNDTSGTPSSGPTPPGPSPGSPGSPGSGSVVTIHAVGPTSLMPGGEIRFQLKVTPRRGASGLTVSYRAEDPDNVRRLDPSFRNNDQTISFLPYSDTRDWSATIAKDIVIPVGGATETITVKSGSGYTVGSPSSVAFTYVRN